MSSSPPPVQRFPASYAHLGEDGSVVPLEVTDSFWPDLIDGKYDHLGPGRLVAWIEFAESWDSWEMHPDGDELVCLMSGSVDFVLELDPGEQIVELREPGAFVVVPRGTWHTASVHAPSAGLFITAGEGTQHRPR